MGIVAGACGGQVVPVSQVVASNTPPLLRASKANDSVVSPGVVVKLESAAWLRSVM